jgi:uncharacterized protein (TIGR03067 family)
MRTTALCLAVAALAFAPAPFPKPPRNNKPEDDLAKLQGTWGGIPASGRKSGGVAVVKGDVWRANTPHDSWTIKLDPTKRPRQIDLIKVGDKNTFFRGIYKLEGDTFTYSLGFNVSEANRPKDFDTSRDDAWVSVFERQKP